MEEPSEVQTQYINFAQIFHALPDLVIISRLSDNRCIEVNQAFLEATGYSREEVKGQLLSELGFKTVSNSQIEGYQFSTEAEGYHNQEIEFYRKTGEQRTGLLLTQVVDLAGSSCLINVVRDITARKQLEEQIQHCLLHDSLTAIPSRSYFVKRLNQVLRQKRLDPNYLAALCFLDLDGFKAINDTFGHTAGDQLLIEASQRLSNISQQQYFVARWGGDEFVLLLEQLQDLSHVTGLANRIIEAFRVPFLLNADAVSCSISMGITLIPEAGITVDELLHQADTAMYQAKAFGKSCYHLFGIEPQFKTLPHEQQYSAMLAQRIRRRLHRSQN